MTNVRDAISTAAPQPQSQRPSPRHATIRWRDLQGGAIYGVVARIRGPTGHLVGCT